MIRFEKISNPNRYFEYKMLNGFVMVKTNQDPNWNSAFMFKTLDDARDHWSTVADWREVATAQVSSTPQPSVTPQAPGNTHLFIYKYASTDMWCQYCNEGKSDWLKRGCPHDCPRRIILRATPQPPIPQQAAPHTRSVQSSQQLNVDNCSCGGTVWLYDPFMHKFNCISCGKKQGDSVSEKKKSDTCFHEWVKYTGLSEQFEFCRICDEKRK